ncbi:MAG TPA: RCC1 domain-containing protein [Polyangiaceae bacterium]|nr:RCC1 domain-containing protein [Polyangiaceae bacterium]
MPATQACWGADADGRTSPPAGTFVQVSGGFDHSCAVRADWVVTCWGSVVR